MELKRNIPIYPSVDDLHGVTLKMWDIAESMINNLDMSKRPMIYGTAGEVLGDLKVFNLNNNKNEMKSKHTTDKKVNKSKGEAVPKKGGSEKPTVPFVKYTKKK